MPFRVRCRCGQEVVLRLGEWVYLLVGLLLVSLAVNAGTMVLLYVELSSESRPEDADRAVGGDRQAPSTVADRIEIDSHGVDSQTATARDGATESSPPPDESADGDAASLDPASLADADSGAVDRGGETETVEARSLLPLQAAGDDGALAAETLLEELVAELVAEKEAPSTSDAVAGVERVDPELSRHAAAAEHSFRILLEDLTPFARVVASDELGPAVAADADEPDETDTRADPVFVAALLHDPDARVRRHAVARLTQWLASRGAPVVHERLERWVVAARPWLTDDGAATQLLERFPSQHAPDADQGAPAQLPWEATRRRAVSRLHAVPGFDALRDLLERDSRQGVDVVVAIDVSESMEKPFDILESTASRWIPAVLWALPDSRLGLLFYRDDVVAVHGFDSRPDGQLRAFRRLEAEGGGDVPEGVYTALETALQLGRFTWRANARKVIAFVGDAPPPYAKIAPMLSLARQARAEGGFQIHAIAVQPEKGRDTVPYFPELAEAGGGEGVTADAVDLPSTLFRLLFPAESRPLVDRSFAALEALDNLDY